MSSCTSYWCVDGSPQPIRYAMSSCARGEGDEQRFCESCEHQRPPRVSRDVNRGKCVVGLDTAPLVSPKAYALPISARPSEESVNADAHWKKSGKRCKAARRIQTKARF